MSDPLSTASYTRSPCFSRFNLGTPASGLPGKTYVACWSHNPLEDTDFLVTIDPEVELHGPFVSELECTLGVACSLELSGVELGTDYGLIVLPRPATHALLTHGKARGTRLETVFN